VPDRITILGAGVSGLTTGVVLAEAGYAVTILAADVTGTTSAAAAAIWLPYHIADERVDGWAEMTREVLTELAGDPSTGVSLIDFHVYGEVLRVPLADTTRYLPYLRARFERAGGRVVVREVRREELAGLEGDLLVNCTGFGARALFGDEELQPGYGVAVIVPRPPIDFAIVTEPEADRLMYVIPRTTDCLLGGYDRPVPPPDSEVAAIVARCRAAVPEVSGEILGVRHGIRPVRPSVRLEAGTVDGRAVVHNYGHGGAGFTVSWGCAGEVGRVVKTARVIAPPS
jgi:D-amino-acid oxidase